MFRLLLVLLLTVPFAASAGSLGGPTTGASGGGGGAHGDGTNCGTAGYAPQGVDANGNAQNCFLTEDGDWEYTIPGSANLSEIDIPWGYDRTCSVGSWDQQDCVGAYYFNIPNPSSGTRTNMFLPAFRSMGIEHSYLGDPETNTQWWYEQNESVQLGLVDVIFTPTGGTPAAGNWVKVGSAVNCGGASFAVADCALAKIISWTGGSNTARLAFNLARHTPVAADVIVEIDGSQTRVATGVTGVWPAPGSVTQVVNSLRLIQVEHKMTGESFTWKWLYPTDLNPVGGITPNRTFVAQGLWSNGKVGMQINRFPTGDLAEFGLEVGGALAMRYTTDAGAPFDTRGGFRLYNSASSSKYFNVLAPVSAVATFGRVLSFVEPSSVSNNSAVAITPRISTAPTSYGIVYMQKANATHNTGTLLCDAIAVDYECSHVLDYGATGANTVTHNDCSTVIATNNWYSASCYMP